MYHVVLRADSYKVQLSILLVAKNCWWNTLLFHGEDAESCRLSAPFHHTKKCQPETLQVKHGPLELAVYIYVPCLG